MITGLFMRNYGAAIPINLLISLLHNFGMRGQLVLYTSHYKDSICQNYTIHSIHIEA